MSKRERISEALALALEMYWANERPAFEGPLTKLCDILNELKDDEPDFTGVTG